MERIDAHEIFVRKIQSISSTELGNGKNPLYKDKNKDNKEESKFHRILRQKSQGEEK